MNMNAALAHSIESVFGPPSEPINITSFIQSTSEIDSTDVASFESSSEQDDIIASECSVSDLHETLFNIWNNPTLSAHLSKDHDHRVSSLYSTVKPTKPKRRAILPDPDSLPPEATALQKSLNNIKLSSWKLQADSVMFMRTSKNSDQNALVQVKRSASSSHALSQTPQAIITISIHDRLSWSPGHVRRASQHVLLSSQTLGDLYGVILCASNELPSEDIVEGNSTTRGRCTTGCVMCIEGVAYGDGLTDVDHSDKLLSHLQAVTKDPPIIVKGTTIHDTHLFELSLRINQPYWLLHYGNCEHFIVVDQIRLQHPSDAPSGYPLTVQITPPLLDLCRACEKVPAVLSIISDVRLGESPCLMCAPCWRVMGKSSDPSVVVRSLPRYEVGW